jgi:nitrate reductase gamma subunit
MEAFYNFLAGPALWLSFIIFFGGLIIRAAFLVGISRSKDGVFYNHFSWGWSLKSVVPWLLPLGTRGLRSQPLLGVVFFVFHLCLLGVPIFLFAHNLLWEEAWGWSLPALPEWLGDIGAWIVIACCAFLFIRRLVEPTVRIMSGAMDYILILLVAAPFVTGALAYHQWGDYSLNLVLHLLSAEVLLIVIPFSKLGHLILFFFTRAFIGSEMGARREQDGRLGARVW